MKQNDILRDIAGALSSIATSLIAINDRLRETGEPVKAPKPIDINVVPVVDRPKRNYRKGLRNEQYIFTKAGWSRQSVPVLRHICKAMNIELIHDGGHYYVPQEKVAGIIATIIGREKNFI